MRKVALTLVALVTTGAVFAPKASAQPMGVGSCYEVRPICMPPQNPLCICDITQNCMWVCK